MLVYKNHSLSLETYLALDFTLLTHLAHKNSLTMCWTSNHQNTYRNGPRAHFPFSYFVSAYEPCKTVKDTTLAAKGGASTYQVRMPLALVRTTSLVAPTAPIIVAVTTPPEATMLISLVF
jgi:hypothetical protein